MSVTYSYNCEQAFLVHFFTHCPTNTIIICSIPSLQKCYPCNPISDEMDISSVATTATTDYDGPYDLCTSIIDEAIELEKGTELWDLAQSSMRSAKVRVCEEQSDNRCYGYIILTRRFASC